MSILINIFNPSIKSIYVFSSSDFLNVLPSYLLSEEDQINKGDNGEKDKYNLNWVIIYNKSKNYGYLIKKSKRDPKIAK